MMSSDTISKIETIVAFMVNELNVDIDVEPFVEAGCREENICSPFVDQDDLLRELGITENPLPPVLQVTVDNILLTILIDDGEIADIIFLDTNDDLCGDDGGLEMLLSIGA